MFENFRGGGGRGMKLSFGRGDIDIGFISYKKYTLVLKKHKYMHTHTQFIAPTDKCNS